MLWFLKRLIIIVYRHAFPVYFLVLPSKLEGLSPEQAALPFLSPPRFSALFSFGVWGIFCLFGFFFGIYIFLYIYLYIYLFFRSADTQPVGAMEPEAHRTGANTAHPTQPLRTRGKATAGVPRIFPFAGRTCKRCERTLFAKQHHITENIKWRLGGSGLHPAERRMRSRPRRCADRTAEPPPQPAAAAPSSPLLLLLLIIFALAAIGLV